MALRVLLPLAGPSLSLLPVDGPPPRASEGYQTSYYPPRFLGRQYVHETLKSDIKNEATRLLKTKGRNTEFSRWRSRYITENRDVNKNEWDTKSW